MAGNARQHVNTRIAVHRKIDFRGPQRDGAVGGQCKGRAAQFHRVNAQQQVVPDGVADKGSFQNVGGQGARALRHF